MTQGWFSYPGIDNPLSGVFTCAHGIEPGRCTIIAPSHGQSPAPVGDLSIHYGTEPPIIVRGMRLRDAENVSDENGDKIRFTFEDRRWNWNFGEVYLDDEEKVPANLLAQVFLNEMKEQGADVSDVPADEEEYASTTEEGRALNGNNPAQELQNLANRYGLRVVYDPLTDRVGIKLQGVGGPLPIDPDLQVATPSIDMSVIPSGVRVLGDFVRVQSFLELEAVGLDVDGTIKPVNKVSYFWNNGLEVSDTSESFARLTNKEERDLAVRSALRWFRVKKTFDVPVVIQAENGISYTMNTSEDIVDISTDLYVDETGQSPFSNTGGRLDKEASVYGYYHNRELSVLEDVTPANGYSDFRLPYDFSFDAKERIVKFPFQVYRREAISQSKLRRQPDLWLYCSYNIRVPSPSYQPLKSKALFSYFLTLNPQSSRVGPDIVRDRKLRWWIWQTTSFNSTYHNWNSNLFSDNLQPQAVELAAKHARKYTVQPASEAVYNRFIKVRLDGAIQAVTWWFGEDGAFTRVSRNTEPDYILTKYQERILIDDVRRKVGAL